MTSTTGVMFPFSKLFMGAVLLSAVLAACGGASHEGESVIAPDTAEAPEAPAEAPAAEVDAVRFTFDWPEGLALEVSSTKETRRVVAGQRQDAPSETVRYTMRAEEADEGLRIAHEGMVVEGMEEELRAATKKLGEVIPDLVVSDDGAFVTFELDEEAAQEMAAQSEGGAPVASLMTREALEPWIRYSWATLAGTWRGAELSPGEAVSMPIEGGGETPAQVELVRLLDCPGRAVSEDGRCAEIAVTHTFPEGEPDPMGAGILRTMRAQGLPVRSGGAEIRIRLITEVRTLVPHRESREHEVVIVVEPPGRSPQRIEWQRMTETAYEVVDD